MATGNRTAILAGLSVILLVIIASSAGAADSSSLIPNLSPAKGPNDLGIIFNTNDLLLGLESYQAGLGAKVGRGTFDLRGLVDFSANGSAAAFGVNLGVTAEYHLNPGPISPYFGWSVGGGYLVQTAITSVLSFSLGAIAGVEVRIADFLSVFAEYAFVANLTNTTDLQTSQSTLDYLVTTGMGNNAKVGVVIYFMRSEAKSK